MATPKPKAESALDEEDYLDLKRTQMTLRLRMQRRRELNDIYQDILEKKEAGKLLSAKPVLELKPAPAKFDWDAVPEDEDV
jgi:hypothetical protein